MKLEMKRNQEYVASLGNSIGKLMINKIGQSCNYENTSFFQ